MILTAIPFSVLLILCILLSKNITLAIEKRDEWRMEIRFTLLGARISKPLTRKRTQSKGTEKERSSRHRYGDYIRLITSIIEYSEVEIYKLSLPMRDGLSEQKSATVPWRYHASLLTLLSFIRSRAKELTIHDNAITLIPDGEKVSVDITLKIRLFHIPRTLLAFAIRRKPMKRRRKYVGK